MDAPRRRAVTPPPAEPEPGPDSGAHPDPRAELDRRFDEAFDRAFSLVAFQVNRHLIDHMLRCARELRVDFESLVIWGVLSHQNVAHLLGPGTPPGSGLDARGRAPHAAGDLRPVRIRDLAQITGLPRETIRRKLLRLQEDGRVRQVASGWVYDGRPIEPELREFTRGSVRRLRATAREIDDALLASLRVLDGDRDEVPVVATGRGAGRGGAR